MTQEEILQYNKRCAEFLGAEINDVLERIYIDKMKDDEMIFHKYSVTLKTYECNGTTNIHYIPFDMLQFHSDWNLIMEVVEAIENIQVKGQYIYSIQPRGAVCEIKCSTQYSLAFDVQMPCIYEIAKSKKEAVVQAINQFLIWYNNEYKS